MVVVPGFRLMFDVWCGEVLLIVTKVTDHFVTKSTTADGLASLFTINCECAYLMLVSIFFSFFSFR